MSAEMTTNWAGERYTRIFCDLGDHDRDFLRNELDQLTLEQARMLTDFLDGIPHNYSLEEAFAQVMAAKKTGEVESIDVSMRSKVVLIELFIRYGKAGNILEPSIESLRRQYAGQIELLQKIGLGSPETIDSKIPDFRDIEALVMDDDESMVFYGEALHAYHSPELLLVPKGVPLSQLFETAEKMFQKQRSQHFMSPLFDDQIGLRTDRRTLRDFRNKPGSDSHPFSGSHEWFSVIVADGLLDPDYISSSDREASCYGNKLPGGRYLGHMENCGQLRETIEREFPSQTSMNIHHYLWYLISCMSACTMPDTSGRSVILGNGEQNSPIWCFNGNPRQSIFYAENNIGSTDYFVRLMTPVLR